MTNKANTTQNSCTKTEKSLINRRLGDSPEHPGERYRSASQKILGGFLKLYI